MIYWIILAVATVLIVLAILDSCFYWWDSFALQMGAILFGVTLAVLTIFIVSVNCTTEGYIAANEQRYESLVYQAENNLYDNDNDIGKKELVNQIQEWNEDLANAKAMQRDFWVGVFYPDIYDNFEYIPMNIIKSN
jgi:hypothetical protein